MSLWYALQSSKNSKRIENMKDFFNQGVFVLICVGVAYFIHNFLFLKYLSSFTNTYLPDFMVQFLLLPVILYISAMIIGPSEEIRIQKPPTLNKKKKS